MLASGEVIGHPSVIALSWRYLSTLRSEILVLENPDDEAIEEYIPFSGLCEGLRSKGWLLGGVERREDE